MIFLIFSRNIKKYKSLPNFKNILQLTVDEEKSIKDIICSILDLLYKFELEEKINDENGEEGVSDDILNNESDESENDNDGNLEENILYEDNIEIKKEIVFII